MTVTLKIFLTTILATAWLQQCQATTFADLEIALQELYDLSGAIQTNLTSTMTNEADRLQNQKMKMTAQVTEEIDHQIKNMTNKILSLSESVKNATGGDVDVCVGSVKLDLDSFSEEWKLKLDECGDQMTMLGENLLYSVYLRFWYELNIDFSCTNKIYRECVAEYQNEMCSDGVLEKIDSAKESFLRASNLFQTEMKNQINGMRFSCRQMILQALSIYPSLILDFARSCLDDIMVSSYSFSC